MKDIFEQKTIDEFKHRIHNLSEDAQPLWGKMNVYQMLKHCSENEKMILQEKSYKRLFFGKLFGRMALKSMIKDDKPLDKNQPTHPEFKIKGEGDVESQKEIWLSLLDKYPQKTAADFDQFVHPFFGKMGKKEVAIASFKHIDHHLRQFGV